MTGPVRRPNQLLRTPARWRSAPVPDGFETGASVPSAGVVRLPLHLEWSSADGVDRDLADPLQRRRVYEIVLTVGDADDVVRYIDPAVLVADWDVLVLPAAVVETWSPWIDAQTA